MDEAKCEKHLFEDATGLCRACRRHFCDECLVYVNGSHAAPLCIPCALTAAGVRSTAARAARGGMGFGPKVAVGVASTAAAVAVVAVPALSHLR